MRIGILTESFEGGGAERQAAIWLQMCLEKGYDVTAVTLRETGHPMESADLRFVCVPKSRTWDFIAVGRRLRQLQRDLDALVAFEPYLGLCCAFAKLDVPWMLVSGKVPYTLRESSRIPMAAYRLAFERASLVSVPSVGVRECHRHMRLREHGSWRVIPNIVDGAAFGATNKQRSGVLFVGRLVAVKDPLLALDSAAMAAATLSILGFGELQSSIEQRINTHGNAPQVSILPFTRNPWPIYARHRVLLVTSVVESFGNVLVEALATGTPVVSVNCDFGPREILSGAAYSHLTERSPAAIGATLARVLDRPYSDDEADECRRIAARYRPQKVYPQIEEALRSVVANPNVARSSASPSPISDIDCSS